MYISPQAAHRAQPPVANHNSNHVHHGGNISIAGGDTSKARRRLLLEYAIDMDRQKAAQQAADANAAAYPFRPDTFGGKIVAYARWLLGLQ